MRKLKCTNTTKTLEVDAKSLQKGDRIWVGKRVFSVQSNTKAGTGYRRIHLKWGSRKKKDDVFLVVPKNMLFAVTKHKHNRAA